MESHSRETTSEHRLWLCGYGGILRKVGRFIMLLPGVREPNREETLLGANVEICLREVNITFRPGVARAMVAFPFRHTHCSREKIIPDKRSHEKARAHACTSTFRFCVSGPTWPIVGRTKRAYLHIIARETARYRLMNIARPPATSERSYLDGEPIYCVNGRRLMKYC